MTVTFKFLQLITFDMFVDDVALVLFSIYKYFIFQTIVRHYHPLPHPPNLFMDFSQDITSLLP